MIKLRIDVDYPYPSRAKSFLCIALRIKSKNGKDYLKNARIIAKMINESQKEVMAYWFFTPYTIPDKRLLDLLDPQKHEVALHVATDALKEWKVLEKQTDRKVEHYTIHGTQNIFARLLWRRKLRGPQILIPKEFPLISFHDETKTSMDRMRYLIGFDNVVKEAQHWINESFVMSIHPEWLFEATEKAKRGPYYDALKTILDVDHDLETLSVRKILSAKIARDYKEYQKNINLTDDFLSKLKERDADIFTLIERKWCCPITNPPSAWTRTGDNIALLKIEDYASWWSAIGKKTRNMVRKAEKESVKVLVVLQSDKLAEGIWKIYNETPIRQGRAFPHFGESLETVAGNMYAEKNSTFIGAYIADELVGFIQMLHGDKIAILSNILSMQKYWDKSVNNALLSKSRRNLLIQG